MSARRAGLVLIGAGIIITGSAVTASATQGHDKPAICHPVEGKGETGYGWNLISPDEASKHIDEATGRGLHVRSDGREDVYADEAGHCPGYVVVTPSPRPSETDSPSPSPSPSETDSPSPSPTPSETDSPSPSPSPSDTGSPSPSPSETASPSITPTDSSTTSPAPTVDEPTPVETVATARRAELAQTGIDGRILGLAGACLAGGFLLVMAGRKGAHR